MRWGWDDQLNLYGFCEAIERLLYPQADLVTLHDEERAVLDTTNRANWVCAAQITVTGMIERRDRDLFDALPFLARVREDRLPFHQFNKDEYYRQAIRWCSYLTANQARKYVLLYGNRLVTAARWK